MEFVHIVLVKPNPETTPEAIDAIIAKVGALRNVIPGIIGFEKGQDVGGNNQGYTHGFVVTFDNEEHFKAYGPHPAHQVVAKEILAISDLIPFDYPRA
jgi:heme-degrading monooxygenase HmoA